MTVEQMQSFLSGLGIQPVNVRGVEIQAHCPAHEERTGHPDANPSWWINSDTGQHICFSCQFKGGMATLVTYFTDGDLTNYKEFVESPSHMMSRLKQVLTERKDEELVHVSESMLSAFVNPPDMALLGRGISPSAAKYHGILWNDKKDSWIMPVRHMINDALLGWQEKGTTQRFFLNYPPKMKKSLSLFGFDRYDGDTMIVVESPLDVARMTSVKIFGGVSTYGTQVSINQFNAMRGAPKLIIAMDNDDAGRKASENLYHLCKEHGKEAWFFDYSHTDVKDIGAMSKVEIESGIENARHIARGIR